MSYNCALRLSIRWGLLGVLLGYLIIGVTSMIIDRPIAYDQLIINLGSHETPYIHIAPISGWIAPLGLFIPISAWMFMGFGSEQLQARRMKRSKNAWAIKHQTPIGYIFGVLGTALVGGAGIAVSVYASVICMFLVMLFASWFFHDNEWKQYVDLSQVLYIPLVTCLVMWTGLTLLVGPLASMVYALCALATATAVFGLWCLPLAINSATKRQQKQLSTAFRRTMLECNPKAPEKC